MKTILEQTIRFQKSLAEIAIEVLMVVVATSGIIFLALFLELISDS